MDFFVLFYYYYYYYKNIILMFSFFLIPKNSFFFSINILLFATIVIISFVRSSKLNESIPLGAHKYIRAKSKNDLGSKYFFFLWNGGFVMLSYSLLKKLFFLLTQPNPINSRPIFLILVLFYYFLIILFYSFFFWLKFLYILFLSHLFFSR